jgi:hypothetical protein
MGFVACFHRIDKQRSFRPMLRLPPTLGTCYRLATPHEVHSWSFGAVKAVRRPDAVGWEQCVFTLDDQRIFGPLRDDQCLCGKYQGTRYRGMICDRCGVKVTTREERRTRFGHVDLPAPVPYPLGDESDLVAAVPVLPAAFRECPAGGGLANAYEELVQAAAAESRDDLAAGLRRLTDCLLPVLTLAHDWALPQSSVLARGLILESRNA